MLSLLVLSGNSQYITGTNELEVVWFSQNCFIAILIMHSAKPSRKLAACTVRQSIQINHLIQHVIDTEATLTTH